MNADHCSYACSSSQLQEVRESMNRLTLSFKSKELQQQYETALYKLKANQLFKIYFLLTSVASIGIIQQSIIIQTSGSANFLILLILISSAFVFLSCLIKFVPKYSRIWNTMGIFAINVLIILTRYLTDESLYLKSHIGFEVLCVIIIFILQRYSNNFCFIIITLSITFSTIALNLSFQFFGFMLISLIIAIYNLYQSEYLQKQAFWFEKFNSQQSHIIENVVTSSLFYIRYNKKEERLEFQRGNKKFCEKFVVKDDDSMRHFLKNTKITNKYNEEQTIHSTWNSVNNSWKSSLDGLIHKMIQESNAKNQVKISHNISNNQTKDITYLNSLLKQKAQNCYASQPQLQQTQNVLPQPLSVIESNGQSGYLSKSTTNKIKNSPLMQGKLIPQTFNLQNISNLQNTSNLQTNSFLQNQTNLQNVNISQNANNSQNASNIVDIDKEKQIEKVEDYDNNLMPSTQQISRQNLNLLSPHQSKRNFLLSDEQVLTSKKVMAEEEYIQEREEMRQIRQSHSRSNKFNRTNSIIQNQSNPSLHHQLKNSCSFKQNSNITNVYQAKYKNQSGEKIKFLVRILIFQMNDTYIAVSIEKEDQIKKYKQLKNKLQFFESVFTQLANETNNKSTQELAILQKMIPLSKQLDKLIQIQNAAFQNIPNQLSSQLISLNIEYPHLSLEKKLQKKLKRNMSLSVNNETEDVKNFNKVTESQIKNNNLKEQPIIAQSTIINTATCTLLNQQGQTTAQSTGTTSTNITALYPSCVIPIPNQIGVLKKPSIQISPSQVQNIKKLGVSNIQDVRDSLFAVTMNPQSATINKVDYYLGEKEGSKISSSSTEKANSQELISGYPTISQFNIQQSNIEKQLQKPQTYLPSSQKLLKSSSNNVLFLNSPQTKIQKGMLQEMINQMLFLTYSGRYAIMNYNYFLKFFKKRTQLNIFNSTNLTQLIENVVQMFKQEMKLKKIQIITDYFDRDIQVDTDQNAFIQILFNLLQNALQYTPQNGYIALKTEQELDQNNNHCIKLKIRNTYSTLQADYVRLPDIDDCKFKLEDMIIYQQLNRKVNLGLRISEKLIKIIGPTDQIKFKSDKNDYFQVQFSFYSDLKIVQKDSKIQSQKILGTSNAVNEKTNVFSNEKASVNLDKGLSASNNMHGIQNEGGMNDQHKRSFSSQKLSMLKQSQNPYNSNNIQAKDQNSDSSFDSFVEQAFQNNQNEVERRSLSADRFKYFE